MAQQLTKKELEAIRHIRNAVIHTGFSPSIRKLGDALNYKSHRSAQDILEKLEEKKIIKKTPQGRYQLLNDHQTNSYHAQTIDVPLIGTISCGTPILAQENIEASIPVSTAMLRRGSKYFILRAQGDSMNLAGINDGDLVLVRQQFTAENGDRVIALIDDEATIKEFNRIGNVIILKPRSSNPKNQPIILTEDFRIQGVAVNVIPIN